MNKTEDLYQPSLEQEWEETKSYDVAKLFYVAFFGGAIPLMVLASMNMKWLNISKKVIYPMFALGSLMIISKFMLFTPIIEGSIELSGSEIRIGYKVACVILFLIYSAILKKPFQQHLLTNRPTLPMLKPALIWIVIGIVVEIIILSLFLI